MAGVSIDDFGASFIDYLPGVTETLNNTVTLRRYARTDYKWEGASINFFVHTARNHAVGNLEDGGNFAVADKQDYQEAQAFRRFAAGSVQVTDGALANAATSKRAAIDVVTSELQGMVEGQAKYDEFMSFQSGTGVVCNLGTDVTGTTFGVTDARLIWDGQTYEVYDSTLATYRGTFTVVSTARALDANGDFAVTSSAAVPTGSIAGDAVVWPNALNRTVTGLTSLVDDAATTFQNINTTTFPRYTSPVLDNGGTNRPLTPTLFRQLLAAIKQEAGGTKRVKGLVCITNCWQAIEVEELYEPELRITPDTKTQGLNAPSFQSSFGRITVETSHDCPFNTMFFVDFSQIYRAVQKELDWRRDKAGGIFSKSDTSAVWRATTMEIFEYFIKQRNKCGKIEDLTETVVTAY
jgi:hypothetical protein